MARYPFESTLTDQQGHILSGGTCTVKLSGTDTAATIYEALTGDAKSDNIVTSGSDGVYKFFVSDSDYNLSQKFRLILKGGPGFDPRTIDDILMFNPLTPIEGTAISSTGEAVTKYLRADGDDTSSWQPVTHTPEGTAVLSTGEGGGTKFLREDGDGTSSWQTAPVTSVSGSTGAVADGDIDHDSLANFAANEHFTQANITATGTVASGTWQGTAVDGTYVDLEGTELKSTGEAGGTKFLREDGDGTCSWQAAAGGIASVAADGSPQLGGFLDANGNYMQTEKGGDIASASPLVIDTDGDYFDVTGTTNFAAMTVAADRQFTLQFDGALTMTHHATNLDLPGEANITTAAGDVGVFQSTGANTVQCISYVKADGTAVVSAGAGTALLGDTADNELRLFTLHLRTKATAHITCQMKANQGHSFNTTDAIDTTQTGNIGKSGNETEGSGATEVNYALNASGNTIDVVFTGFNVTSIWSSDVLTNDSGQHINMNVSVVSGNLDIIFKTPSSGASVDLTGIADGKTLYCQIGLITGGGL